MLDVFLTPETLQNCVISKPVQLVAEGASLASLVALWRAETEPIRRCAAAILGGSLALMACWFVGYLCGMTN